MTSDAKAVRPALVLIVDDHPIVCAGLQLLLEREADLHVEAVADGYDLALHYARERCFDLVLVDISLGDANGLTLIKELHAEDPELPVLALSMHPESIYAERALRAGARGYVMKQEAAKTLLEAIRRALRGQVHVSPAITNRLVHQALGASVRKGMAIESCLTDREIEVFHLIGQGEGTKDLAKRLGVSVKTVETHRAHIKRKLGIDSASRLVQRAVEWVQHQGAA